MCLICLSLFLGMFSSLFLFDMKLNIKLIVYTSLRFRPLPLGASPQEVFESPPPIYIESFVRYL